MEGDPFQIAFCFLVPQNQPVFGAAVIAAAQQTEGGAEDTLIVFRGGHVAKEAMLVADGLAAGVLKAGRDRPGLDFSDAGLFLIEV